VAWSPDRATGPGPFGSEDLARRPLLGYTHTMLKLRGIIWKIQFVEKLFVEHGVSTD